jgi:hypothetical protein
VTIYYGEELHQAQRLRERTAFLCGGSLRLCGEGVDFKKAANNAQGIYVCEQIVALGAGNL